MSSPWKIDLSLVDAAEHSKEKRWMWVLKGNNQFANAYQHIQDLLGSLSDVEDSQHPSTIEFVSTKEAIITMGMQQFTITHTPVDFLDIFSQNNENKSLQFLGKAAGRFLIADSSAMDSSQAPALKRARHHNESINSSNLQDSLSLAKPKIIDPVFSSMVEEDDYTQDTTLNTAITSTSQPTNSVKNTNKTTTKNSNKSNSPSTHMSWVRVSNIPLSLFRTNINKSNDNCIDTNIDKNNGNSVLPQPSLYLLVKQLFPDLQILTLHASPWTVTDTLVVYVHLTSSAAVALSLKHPQIALSSLPYYQQQLHSNVIPCNHNDEYAKCKLRLSAVGALEGLFVERGLSAICAPISRNNDNTTSSHCSIGSLSMTEEQFLNICNSFYCDENSCKEFIARYCDPYNISKLCQEVLCTTSGVTTAESAPVATLGVLPLSEENVVVQLHAILRRQMYSSVSQTVSTTTITTMLPDTTADSIKNSYKRSSIGNDSVENKQEDILAICHITLCALQQCLSVSAPSNHRSNDNIGSGVVQRWLWLWQGLAMLLQRRRLRHQQVEAFLPHFLSSVDSTTSM